MSLELKNVVKRVGADTHIHETNLYLRARARSTCSSARRCAGKTTLMQLMAGLERPTSGEICVPAARTSPACRCRSATSSMVYQQFINYPNFTVYENIASPLRVAGMPRREIERASSRPAELLRLTPMLQRRPSELSGGQQQRTAIARALVKDSDLILLDEPLANLDYKLREELRDELPKLFAGRNCIVVYATTEPTEALLFGGNTATLHEGRVTQFGPTAEIYRQPARLITARVFSDPPINTAPVIKHGGEILIGDSDPAARRQGGRGDPRWRLHDRHPPPSHHAASRPTARRAPVEGRVLVTELSRLGKRHPFRPQRPDLGVAVARHPSLPGRLARRGSMSTSTRASSSTTTIGSSREAPDG